MNRISTFFASVTDTLIIEFVPKSDEKVQLMLRNRADIFDNYTEENFQQAFSNDFIITKSALVGNSQRTLYLMRRKNQ